MSAKTEHPPRIAGGPPAGSGGNALWVPLNMIDDDPRNPRGDVGDVTALRIAIKARGQQEPLHLIPKGGGRYLIHEGHRRRKALTELGRTHAKAIEQHFATELEQLLSQGVMHAHRKDFNPMAWARYCHRLYWEHGMDREGVARELGVSQRWVRDHISFTTLNEQEQSALERGILTRGEALRRLAERRAIHNGHTPQQFKKTTAPARHVPAQRRPRGEPHFNTGHILAEQAAARCMSRGAEHAARPKIGGVACGQCWEDAIRADARTPAAALAAA